LISDKIQFHPNRGKIGEKFLKGTIIEKYHLRFVLFEEHRYGIKRIHFSFEIKERK